MTPFTPEVLKVTVRGGGKKMKRILVADDSVTIQKVIALTFAEEPFEVQSVGTGSEALELVNSWNPDIILADVIMPQMNGYELCKAVKQQGQTRSIPVLLLAGTFEAFDEEEARSVGADDFITKPFESGELISKVKALVGVVPAPDSPGPSAGEGHAAVDTGSAKAPDAVPQAAAAPAAREVSEPDIWDILSDSAGDVSAPASEGGESVPGFGPIEDTGVVDVGSFDVGIGRTESPASPPQSQFTTPAEPVASPGMEKGPAPSQVQAPPATPNAVEHSPDTEEKSRVENMEKDFFGFETGAVEEIPAADFLDDAVEEVTFTMEQPQAPEETDEQEVSFVVPEPAGDQPDVTGETIPPDFMAPPPSASPAPGRAEAKPADSEAAVPGGAEQPVPPSFSPAPEAVGDREVFVSPDSAGDGFENIPEPLPAPPVEAPADLEVHPLPEPPLELSVDLDKDLQEGFSPEPMVEPEVVLPGEMVPEPEVALPGEMIPEPAAEVRAENVPEPGLADPPAARTAADITDEAAIRKILEEKVEKIVWEVVPEMAEVMIREAIQKIKDGS